MQIPRKKTRTLLAVLFITGLGLAQQPGQSMGGTYKWALITIDGMACQEGCAATIEKNLLEATGVLEATVLYETGKANVYFDEALISMASIKQLITGTKVKDYVYRIEEVTYLNHE